MKNKVGAKSARFANKIRALNSTDNKVRFKQFGAGRAGAADAKPLIGGSFTNQRPFRDPHHEMPSRTGVLTTTRCGADQKLKFQDEKLKWIG